MVAINRSFVLEGMFLGSTTASLAAEPREDVFRRFDEMSAEDFIDYLKQISSKKEMQVAGLYLKTLSDFRREDEIVYYAEKARLFDRDNKKFNYKG